MVIFGKHPAFGDFLSYGMDRGVLHRLETWLEHILPALKSGLGAEWERAWAAAPPLYFWLGPDILGAPLMGVFIPSQDKVGRRFPLMLGLSDVVTPPPLHPDHDAQPYLALSAHLAAFEVPSEGLRGAESLAEGFSAGQVRGDPFVPGQDATLWGHREDGDLARLFVDARAGDADKAQMGRSHWWHARLPHRQAGWLGANGLPDHASMKWLLTGRSIDGDKHARTTND